MTGRGLSTLQREHLPSGVPVLPRADVAAIYLQATEGAAGGDWFDVVPIPDGRLALVVGDMVGHGAEASVAMGQLRAVLHAHLSRGGTVQDAMNATDEATAAIPGTRSATLCVAVLDANLGTVTYCTSGHPPPLVVSESQPGRYLPSTGTGALGTGSPAVFRTEALRADEFVLLYTNGIAGQPGVELEQAMRGLRRTTGDVLVRHPSLPPDLRAGDKAVEATFAERVCLDMLHELASDAGRPDDVVLLGFARRAKVPDLELRTRAKPSAARDVRALMGQWLTALGAPAVERIILQHAVSELVTNAVQHAYRPTDVATNGAGATVEIRAALDSRGVVDVTVADHGMWRQPAPGPGAIRGLAMVSDLTDSLAITRLSSGTTARITRRLLRPPLLLAGEPYGAEPDPPRRVGPPNSEVLIISHRDEDDGLVRLGLDGPVDEHSSEALRQEIQEARLGGSREIVLDMERVTFLGSSGIAVLHQKMTTTSRDHVKLTIFAPEGSPAHYVLTILALPHTTVDPPNASRCLLRGSRTGA